MAISAHDVVPDSPTNTFATLNPLTWSHATSTLSDGNLKWTQGTGNMHSHAFCNLGTKTGKFYFEVCTGTASTDSCCVGIIQNKVNGTLVNGVNGSRQLGQNLQRPAISVECRGFGCLNADGTEDFGNPVTYSGGASVNGSTGILTGSSGTYNGSSNTPGFATFTSANIVIGVYLDFTGATYGEIQVKIGSASWEVLTSYVNLDEVWFPAISGYNTDVWYINTGQDPTFGGIKTPTTTYTDANGIGSFYYEPPTGALALCTANLPDPTIDPAQDDVPEDYMKAVLYTGNGTGQSITGVGFQPDLVWIKDRDTAYSNYVQDSVRGNTKVLITNATNTETIYTNGVTSFDSTGFSLGNNSAYNRSGDDYVAWCWKAGGAPSADDKGVVDGVERTITGDAKLDAGTITPTRMSVNTKAGFSIVSYTGTGSAATIPHGLNAAPEMYITKGISVGANWVIYLADLGAASIRLNLTTGELGDVWGAVPTTSVFSIGGSLDVNSSGETFIAYCWHSVAGYSKFGSYTGNGLVDGPFVYTGFRPAWVMIKSTASGNWILWDTSRSLSNLTDDVLYPNLSNAEDVNSGGRTSDFLSNGFKIRSSHSDLNTSGTTYIYAAFAEQPFNYSNAR